MISIYANWYLLCLRALFVLALCYEIAVMASFSDLLSFSDQLARFCFLSPWHQWFTRRPSALQLSNTVVSLDITPMFAFTLSQMRCVCGGLTISFSGSLALREKNMCRADGTGFLSVLSCVSSFCRCCLKCRLRDHGYQLVCYQVNFQSQQSSVNCARFWLAVFLALILLRQWRRIFLSVRGLMY